MCVATSSEPHLKVIAKSSFTADGNASVTGLMPCSSGCQTSATCCWSALHMS